MSSVSRAIITPQSHISGFPVVATTRNVLQAQGNVRQGNRNPAFFRVWQHSIWPPDAKLTVAPCYIDIS